MKKEKDILIRVTFEFKEKIQLAAKKAGLSVSSYIRMVILEKLNSK